MVKCRRITINRDSSWGDCEAKNKRGYFSTTKKAMNKQVFPYEILFIPYEIYCSIGIPWSDREATNKRVCDALRINQRGNSCGDREVTNKRGYHAVELLMN
jgi:hypothetical protein